MDLLESDSESNCWNLLFKITKYASIISMEPVVHNSLLPRRSQSQYPGSPDAATQPIWTTARCNRLLRPLSSKLASFRKSQALSTKRDSAGRKDLKSTISHSTDCHCAFTTSAVRATTEVICQASTTPNANISDWTPSPRPRKRIKRTYSSKELGHLLSEEPIIKPKAGISSAKISKLCPESLIKVRSYSFKVDQLCPFIEEQKIPEKPAPIRVQSLGQNGILRTDMLVGESFRRFAKTRYPDGWQLIEGINNGLETLLKVTAKIERTSTFGARSLFSTCLKCVPQYISIEENFSKAEDPENKADISSAIYGELEAYGSSLRGGWKPLKEVVRAHGVAMLGSAIQDGLIELPVAYNLVRVCLNHGAFDEGQHIVECIMTIIQNLLKSASIKSKILAYGLFVLNQFSSFSGRFGFQFQQLADIFRNCDIPIGWILSDAMSECWSRVMGSIADGDSASRDAGILLQTVALMTFGVSDMTLTSKIQSIRLQPKILQKFMGIKSYRARHAGKVFRYPSPGNFGIENIKSASQTISSELLAAICAINLLGNSTLTTRSEDMPEPRLQVLQIIVLQVCQILETYIPYVDPEKNQVHVDQLFLPLLAAGLSSAIAGNSDLGLSYYLSIIKGVNLSHELSNSAVSFLCAVANFCERAISGDGFYYIQKITQELVEFYTSCNSELGIRVFIGDIAANTAIQYSRSTSVPKHLSWALEIESLVNRMAVDAEAQTPGKTLENSFVRTKLGFRWEEGICEWVAGTPRIPIPKPNVYKDQDATNSGPDLSHKIAAAIALQLSPVKSSTCLAQVSVTSPKLNSKAFPLENKSNSFENRSYGVFLKVEIDKSRRTDALLPKEDLKRKTSFSDDLQNTHQSSTVARVEKPSPASVELRIDQDAESADELSFS